MEEAFLEVSDKVEISKYIGKSSSCNRKFPSLYPSVTITGTQSSRSRWFSFNVASKQYLFGPRVKVSIGKINGEKCLCFENSDSQKDYVANVSGNRVYIIANAALESVGMKGTEHKFIGRRCYPIKNGLAFKIY